MMNLELYQKIIDESSGLSQNFPEWKMYLNICHTYLGQHNIRINSIAPGSVTTKRQSKLWLNPKFKKEILDKQCLKKQVLPEDVSRMVLYLASDVSSGCTKQNFTVDAGLI